MNGFAEIATSGYLQPALLASALPGLLSYLADGGGGTVHGRFMGAF